MNMQRGMPPEDKVRKWVLEGFHARDRAPCTAYMIRTWINQQYGKLIPSKFVKEVIDEAVVEKLLEPVSILPLSPLRYFRSAL